MDDPNALRFEALRRSALDVTRDWPAHKSAMALRAAGFGQGSDARESLDAVAADSGVSRETVRRARNNLLAAVENRSAQTGQPLMYSLTPPSPGLTAAKSPATVRALRRLLTMTGPLAWDEVLSAWARAGGKHPYVPLPTDIASMREWTRETGGVIVTPTEEGNGLVTVLVEHPERLDKVSEFLYDVLRGQAAGIDRVALLDAAEGAGLKATTIATALSQHPAVMRLGRGTWALRGHRHTPSLEAKPVPTPRGVYRSRPTTFSWAADGTLFIEFSIPRGPSPVLAVPRAVADLIEGREFLTDGRSVARRITIGKARLWGFGPLVSEQGLTGGQRARLSINLLTGTASLMPLERKDPGR